MISFDLMQQQASIRLVRGEPMHGMAVNSMLGTAKNDEQNWSFRFQRLTNVCLQAPEVLFRPEFVSFLHQMVVLVVTTVYVYILLYSFVCLVLCTSRELFVHQATIGSCMCISSNTIHLETWWNCL